MCKEVEFGACEKARRESEAKADRLAKLIRKQPFICHYTDPIPETVKAQFEKGYDDMFKCIKALGGYAALLSQMGSENGVSYSLTGQEAEDIGWGLAMIRERLEKIHVLLDNPPVPETT